MTSLRGTATILVVEDEDAHFIGKPYSTEELKRTVREVLDSPDGDPTLVQNGRMLGAAPV